MRGTILSRFLIFVADFVFSREIGSCPQPRNPVGLFEVAVNTASVESPDGIARQELVERILASRHFIKAPLLSAFLAYACRRAMQDGAERITEQEIGVNVFDRRQGYDSKEDNIVRNYARQLRKRLDEYYSLEGRTESLRIEIPKGGYVPVFTENHSFAAQPSISLKSPPDEARTQPSGISPSVPSSARGFKLFASAAVLCLLLACGVAMFLRLQPKTSPANNSPMHRLWTELFVPGKNTLIIPADTAFVMLQEIEGKSFSLREYVSWSSVDSGLKNRKYTSITDVEAVSQLERLPEVNPDRCVIRAARSLTVEDLKDANMIFIGSIYSIPWIEVLQNNLNFRFIYKPAENRRWIENRSPAAGESATYASDRKGLSEKTYSVLAFIPNLNKSGHILLVQGLDGSGTEAAMSMLIHDGGLSEVLNKMRSPDGTIGSFEVLLESISLNSRTTSTRVVAARKSD